MSTNSSKRSTVRTLVTGGIAAAAIVAPMAMAVSPAQAVSSSGCTVTPLAPVFAGFNSAGNKLVRYRVKISCAADRSVFVQQRRYEDDTSPDADDLIGSSSFTRSFSGARTITVSIVGRLPNTENGNEEMYQTARFRVTSNGVTSPYSRWERSPIVSMPN